MIMKNKFSSAGLRCALLAGLSIGFVSPSIAQGESKTTTSPEQVDQIVKESIHIQDVLAKSDFDAIVQLKKSLESDWKPKNKTAYLGLLLEFGIKLTSSKLSFSEGKRTELLETFSASFFQEFDAMILGQKVKTVMFFSNVGHGKIPYNDETSKQLDLVVKTESALEELKTTGENLPIPEKVDLSKYDWSSQPMFISGMSAQAIKDPELRKVYQRALDRNAAIGRKSSIAGEVAYLGKIFSFYSASFIERLDVSSDENKADVQKKLDAPELKKLKGSIVVPLLEAKLKEVQVKSAAPQ
jgi:hypothetical protein